MNKAKKQRLLTAKFMRHKELLLSGWEVEIKKRAKSLKAHPVWEYYSEQESVAKVVGLREELHNMCLHFLHLQTHGRYVRKQVCLI